MDLEQKAIERMQKASEISMKLFGQPLVVTYSGGKDSDVVLQIAKNAKIPFEVLHNLTTADAPETVYHIRNSSGNWNWTESSARWINRFTKGSGLPCGI